MSLQNIKAWIKSNPSLAAFIIIEHIILAAVVLVVTVGAVNLIVSFLILIIGSVCGLVLYLIYTGLRDKLRGSE